MALHDVLAYLGARPARSLTIALPDLNIRLHQVREPQVQGTPIPMPPRPIIEFCAKESGEFARADMLDEAQRLYREFENWDAVLAQLTTKYEPDTAVR